MVPTGPTRSDPIGGSGAIGALAHEVHLARSEVQCRRNELAGRAGNAGHAAFADAQRRLWQALETYVGALDAQGLPVPRRVRAELHLHRELFADHRKR